MGNQYEYKDNERTLAASQGTAFNTFATALAAAKTLTATANTTAIADGGAAAGTKSDILAANTAVAALSLASLGATIHS